MQTSDWRCPYCGSRTKRYSPARRAILCEQCRHPVEDPEEDLRRRDYDRTLALAGDHLRVGNWDACRQLLQPLCDRNPADARLYSMLLAAITKNYTDLLLSPSSPRKEAQTCWDRLSRLGKLTNQHRAYGAKRERAYEKLLLDRLRRALACIVVLGMCLIGLTISPDGICAAAMLCGICFFSWEVFQLAPVKTRSEIRRLHCADRSDPLQWHQETIR